MRHRDLREADRARQRGERLLVRRETIAVHQHDRDRADSRLVRVAQRGLRRRDIERPHHLPARTDALVDLDHALVEKRRQIDPAHEQFRAILIADPQRIRKAARDDERGPLAFTLQQCVGGDCRAHFHGTDRAGRDRRARREPEQLANAVDGSVAIAFRVLGQQLARRKRPVGPARDDVGERAAAVDPEFPAAGGGGRFDHRRNPSILFCHAREDPRRAARHPGSAPLSSSRGSTAGSAPAPRRRKRRLRRIATAGCNVRHSADTRPRSGTVRTAPDRCVRLGASRP